MNETEALLAQLRDIQAPSVSMIPAIGWWILAVSVLLSACLIYIFYRRYQRKGWQREALNELEQLRSTVGRVPTSNTLSSTSTLVRRVVLAARPRTDVASVHGQAWLDLLDGVCGKPLFTEGFGRLLSSGPYQDNPSLGDEDLNALMDVVAELIEAAGRSVASRVPS